MLAAGGYDLRKTLTNRRYPGIVETAKAALEAGATGLMFSETFAGGTVRMIRETTRERKEPPVLYGHNAGIGVKTRSISGLMPSW